MPGLGGKHIRPLVSGALALALLLPVVSAYAESFSVTTNKDLYTTGEKAIIVGVIPEDAPEGYAVLVKVTGPDGSECAVQNILPDSDKSFVSRPLSLSECGMGQYLINAYYAEMAANSTFTVSNSTQVGTGNKLELRLLKHIAMNTEETVNNRLKQFLESNHVLPEDIADRYSLGVFEASLVLQAVDYGDSAEAKKHLIFAVNHFRQVMQSMDSERFTFEHAAALNAADEDNQTSILARYDKTKEYYFRLEEVARKNNVGSENDFGSILSLLAKSKQLVDDGDLQGAQRSLDEANLLLESIRRSLYSPDLPEDSSNATSTRDVQASRLASIADKFERTAYSLLEGSPTEQVNATVQKVLGLVSSARVSIDTGDYKAARDALSLAFSALDDARNMAKDDGHDEASGGGDGGSGSVSDGGEGSGSDQGTGRGK